MFTPGHMFHMSRMFAPGHMFHQSSMFKPWCVLSVCSVCFPVPCDDSWWYESERCYTWSNVPRTWHDAAADCGQRSARLPVINSTVNQKAVKGAWIKFSYFVILSDFLIG